jgi:hypothetical protein
MSGDSSVGIATGYRLDDRGVGVRVSVGSRPALGPTNPSYPTGTRGSFPRSKAAEA